jgi:hypothetical protein
MRMIALSTLALARIVTSVDAQNAGDGGVSGAGPGGSGGRHHGEQQKKAGYTNPEAEGR